MNPFETQPLPKSTETQPGIVIPVELQEEIDAAAKQIEQDAEADRREAIDRAENEKAA